MQQASIRNEDCRTRTWNDKRPTFHLCIWFTHVDFSIQNQQSHYCYPMSLCDSVFKGNYHYKIGKRFYCNTFPKHWISAHFLNNILPHDESLLEQNKWKIVKVSELTVSGWAEINEGPGYVTHHVTVQKGDLYWLNVHSKYCKWSGKRLKQTYILNAKFH